MQLACELLSRGNRTEVTLGAGYEVRCWFSSNSVKLATI